MANAAPNKSFVLQNQVKKTSRQPLEVRHLSHDLRGPLNSILGFAELLAEEIEGPLNEIQTEDINAIYQSAKKLLALINTVVDLSRLEAGTCSLNLGPVELEPLFNKVLANDAIEAGRVIVNISDAFPSLNGERERVEHMVFNLIDFALQIKDVKELRVSATHNTAQATLQFTAVNGVMNDDDLDDVFDLTVAVDDAGRSTLTTGGLHMPLTYRLAVAHQGRLEVKAQPGTGIIFNLQLPLYVPDE